VSELAIKLRGVVKRYGAITAVDGLDVAPACTAGRESRFSRLPAFTSKGDLRETGTPTLAMPQQPALPHPIEYLHPTGRQRPQQQVPPRRWIVRILWM
jgi:hypothetical protein